MWCSHNVWSSLWHNCTHFLFFFYNFFPFWLMGKSPSSHCLAQAVLLKVLSNRYPIFVPENSSPKEPRQNNYQKAHFPTLLQQTFETHQDAVEKQRAEWNCVFLWKFSPLPALCRSSVAVCSISLEAALWMTNKWRDTMHLKRTKAPRKPERSFSLLQRRNLQSQKETSEHPNRSVIWSTFKWGKASLKFKAPFNPAWFHVTSLRALCAPAIRRKFRVQSSLHFPSESFPRASQGALSKRPFFNRLRLLWDQTQGSTWMEYQNFMHVMEVLQKSGEQQ